MSDNTKLSPAQAAVNAALVAQYIEPARIIGRKSKAIEAAKGDTWGAFKDGSRIGHEAGQDATTVCKGLSLACASVGVPQGSVNAYLPILRKLHTDVMQADEAGRAELWALSIKDARAKYQPKKEKAKPATPKPATTGEAGNAEAGDGTTGDADGMMGGTERSRLLSAINAELSKLTDADLSAFLAMLTGEASTTGEATGTNG